LFKELVHLVMMTVYAWKGTELYCEA